MNTSEQQYTDLFTQFRKIIDEASSPELNSRRDQAFNDFVRLGFPVFKSENYQQTDIPKAFADDYGMNIKRLNIPVDAHRVFHCDVPNLSTNLFFMVNDAVAENGSSKLPENVFAGNINEFSQKYPEIFAKYYGNLADTSANGLVAFNTMFAQDGYVLYIPKNTIIERPIQLINVLRGDISLMANRRLLIIVEENAQGKLLVCDHTVDEDTQFLATQVTEIYVADNALFDFYELEETTVKTTRFASCFVSQGAGSNVVINSTTLHNGNTRNNYHVFLNGEYAETHLSGIAISDKTQRTDNFVNILHNVPNCLSNQLFKYVLDEASVGSFTGRIIVAQDAQKTNAYQTNRNLCLTREAKMFSKPQLEIYADDVKCSHGMTTGQLDENALFYLRSRGLSEKDARLLLMFAFTNDVLESIRIDALKLRLHSLVERRFKGELARCRGCEYRC